MTRRVLIWTVAGTLVGLVAGLSAYRESDSGADQSTLGLGEVTWRSEHFDVSVKLADGWRKAHANSPGDTYDRPDGMIAAFVNKSGPYSYLLKVEGDLPLDQVSMEEYLDAIRNQYTANQSHELIDESDVELHGRRFHRLRFKYVGTKGPGSVFLHIFRDGSRFISIQWSFPISDNGTIAVPPAITDFDHGVIALEERSR